MISKLTMLVLQLVLAVFSYLSIEAVSPPSFELVNFVED